MKTPLRPITVAGIAAALATSALRADDAEAGPEPAVPLNYKIEVRCKFGDSPEQVFRLSDADGLFAAEHPSPPIIFEAMLDRREGSTFVIKYACAWRQDIKEAPRDPQDPTVPLGKGSFNEGSAKGKTRLAIGRPAVVFDGVRSKVTITLLEIPALVDSDLKPIEIRQAVRVTESE